MKQHKYTHLGKAPYQFVGYFYDPAIQAPDGSWSGGSHVCDHCGRPISHVFECVSSDGKRFNLGSVHVEDLGDEGLTQAVRSKAQEVKREARKEAQRIKAMENAEKWRKQEQEEREARLANRESEIARITPILASQPHPRAYFAKQGKTMLDYAQWTLDNRGQWYYERVLRDAGAKI